MVFAAIRRRLALLICPDFGVVSGQGFFDVDVDVDAAKALASARKAWIDAEHLALTRQRCPQFMDLLERDYFRAEAPSLEDCFRRADRLAELHNYASPSLGDVCRAIDAIPHMTGLRDPLRYCGEAVR